ncbi:hypothetical protein JZ751_010465 [Albula glossodonta]|uniref:Uncharacterized protein n=1 Tax=Albula glossodonta TaxID=121402 RepID=A0A8T2P5C7_9TELE|nr:hypothetical protein JZ751_010465 [Albula glossodonta]
MKYIRMLFFKLNPHLKQVFSRKTANLPFDQIQTHPIIFVPPEMCIFPWPPRSRADPDESLSGMTVPYLSDSQSV